MPAEKNIATRIDCSVIEHFAGGVSAADHARYAAVFIIDDYHSRLRLSDGLLDRVISFSHIKRSASLFEEIPAPFCLEECGGDLQMTFSCLGNIFLRQIDFAAFNAAKHSVFISPHRFY